MGQGSPRLADATSEDARLGRTRLPGSRYGWVMVATTFVLSGLAMGAVAAVSVFMAPLTAEFGWSRAEAALGYSIAAMASAAFGVLWGYVADRRGTRHFGTVAALVMTACLVLLSRQGALVEFYVLYFIFGAAGTALVSAPLIANVGFWFRRNAGLAIGIAAAGGAAGQALVPLLAGFIIARSDWQSAYLALAGLYLVIALPISFLVREAPARAIARTHPGDDDHRFPLHHYEVLTWIGVAVIFCCNCMSVPIVHLVPLMIDAGHAPQVAASVLAVVMLAGVAGRIAAGRLADLIGALPAYLGMSAGQTLCVVWFPQMSSLGGVYALAVPFGICFSGVMSALFVCARTMVPAHFGARAMSLISLFGWIGMAMGGFMGGVFYDWRGGYGLAFSYASMMGAVNFAILCLFFLRIRVAAGVATAAPAVVRG